jgi:hypothetical protein
MDCLGKGENEFSCSDFGSRRWQLILAELVSGEVDLFARVEAIQVVRDPADLAAQKVASVKILDDERSDRTLSPGRVLWAPTSRIDRGLARPCGFEKSPKTLWSQRGVFRPLGVALRDHPVPCHMSLTAPPCHA